ncbi:urease accessory protein UreF [Roseicyclus persicicus]|uniref:Urease accessory protein UreF n=1 Tax=Roseicyclus persicicus TaxID=2650661 RepID=A0A7X6H2A6_9RHOB|nr:urease accessory UreF family protein [Roseibacterium persicicum]NKX45863.1 urease accessory protein UreF [Roseibacterium persicicum]
MGEADLLKLSQWLSPGFPVSSYAYSHGLEAEIAAGRVRDAGALRDWVAGVLAAGAGRTDAILMLAARRGEEAPDRLADLARALAGARERLEETEAQGRALAVTLAGLGVGDGVPRPYPVALGLAARGLDLPDRLVAALYLQAFAGVLVSAAVRFVPLGQGEGQRVLAALHPVIEDVAGDACAAGLDGIGGAVFGADLAAMEHEGLEVRIFRT